MFLQKKPVAKPKQPAQFIVVTHRAPIVTVASKVYGVEHSNRVSTVREISARAAVKFVQSVEAKNAQQQGQGARGAGGGGKQVGTGKAVAGTPGGKGGEGGTPAAVRRPSKRQKENSVSEGNGEA